MDQKVGSTVTCVMTLDVESGELKGLLADLKSDLETAPNKIREQALDLLRLAPELVRVDEAITEGAGVTILLEPSQWLRDLAAAVRAGDLDGLLVKNAH